MMTFKIMLMMMMLFFAVVCAKPTMNLEGISVRAKTVSPSPSPKASSKATTASPKATKSTTTAATCFPGGAMVQLEDGSHVTMEKLRVGDKVAVGNGKFSEVFMFTHQLKGEHKFVRIETENKLMIEASEGHYMWVEGELKEAQNVNVGDRMAMENGIYTKVIGVQMDVVREGLYNPQTRHGDIVVNNIIASTYTKVANAKIAHAAFAPLRAMFGSVGGEMKWNNALADMVYVAVDKLWA